MRKMEDSQMSIKYFVTSLLVVQEVLAINAQFYRHPLIFP